MFNYFIEFSYNGKEFYGSQVQNNVRTVQGVIENKLALIFKNYIKTIFSGRTDRGVHAYNQVLNFIDTKYIPPHKLQIALNSLLPKDIYVKRIKFVNNDFNARFDAISREYRYYFSNELLPLHMIDHYLKTSFIPDLSTKDFITEFMNGKLDFYNFCCNKQGIEYFVRMIYNLEINKKTLSCFISNETYTYYEIKIEANSFLYKMVRCLVSQLLLIFNNKIDLQDFKNLFKNKEKYYDIVPVQPHGLTLYKINY